MAVTAMGDSNPVISDDNVVANSVIDNSVVDNSVVDNKVVDNVVQLTPRRAQRNLQALREAQRRHPSYVGRLAREADTPTPCRILQFTR